MPLRQFPIGPVGEEVYPRLVSQLAGRLDDAALDRNDVVRDTLTQLYLGRGEDYARAMADSGTPLATKALLASFDPRNATMEAEYYREIDPQKWAPVKPLLWLWQMFDRWPAGRNGPPARRLPPRRPARACTRSGRRGRTCRGSEFPCGATPP